MNLLNYLESIAIAGTHTVTTLKAQKVATELLQLHSYILEKCQNDDDLKELREIFSAALTAEIAI